jgi:Fe2+ transport system protein FeoA
MMSPLALLNEGETAEIVAHHSRHGHAHTREHAHHHGHGSGHCGGNCANCKCHSKGQGGTFTNPNDHLENMGLRPGKQVEMITNSGTGPLVLRVDECRIAMGRGAAMKFYVRRIEE